MFSLLNPWITAYLHLKNLTFICDFVFLILKNSTLLSFFAALSAVSSDV